MYQVIFAWLHRRQHNKLLTGCVQTAPSDEKKTFCTEVVVIGPMQNHTCDPRQNSVCFLWDKYFSRMVHSFDSFWAPTKHPAVRLPCHNKQQGSRCPVVWVFCCFLGGVQRLSSCCTRCGIQSTCMINQTTPQGLPKQVVLSKPHRLSLPASHSEGVGIDPWKNKRFQCAGNLHRCMHKLSTPSSSDQQMVRPSARKVIWGQTLEDGVIRGQVRGWMRQEIKRGQQRQIPTWKLTSRWWHKRSVFKQKGCFTIDHKVVGETGWSPVLQPWHHGRNRSRTTFCLPNIGLCVFCMLDQTRSNAEGKMRKPEITSKIHEIETRKTKKGDMDCPLILREHLNRWILKGPNCACRGICGFSLRCVDIFISFLYVQDRPNSHFCLCCVRLLYLPCHVRGSQLLQLGLSGINFSDWK